MKIDEVAVGWAKTRQRCAQKERAWTERKKFWERFCLLQPTLDLLRTICVIVEIGRQVDVISLLW